MGYGIEKSIYIFYADLQYTNISTQLYDREVPKLRQAGRHFGMGYRIEKTFFFTPTYSTLTYSR